MRESLFVLAFIKCAHVFGALWFIKSISFIKTHVCASGADPFVEQVVKREQAAPAAAPGAAASQVSAQSATVEAAPCVGMSCALCPPGLANPFLPPAAASADDLDALRSVQDASFAANQASAPSPATDDFSARVSWVRNPHENYIFFCKFFWFSFAV